MTLPEPGSGGLWGGPNPHRTGSSWNTPLASQSCPEDSLERGARGQCFAESVGGADGKTAHQARPNGTFPPNPSLPLWI